MAARPRLRWRFLQYRLAGLFVLRAHGAAGFTGDAPSGGEDLLDPDKWHQPEQLNVADCPEGYYRTWLMVFTCASDGGTGRILMPPSGQLVEVQEIPSGIRNFQVMLISQTPARILFWDKETDADIVGSLVDAVQHKDNGVSGVYHGVHLDCGTNEGHNFCSFHGTLPISVSLRIRSSSQTKSGLKDSATLRYMHEGLSSCPVAPRGCGRYDRHKAEKAVLSWSQDQQQHHPNAGQAWSAEAEHVALTPSGIPWHEWVVTSHFAPTWELAFRFLDTDGNQFISPQEFAVGFDFAAPVTTTTTTTTTTTRKTVLVQTTTTFPKTDGLRDSSPAAQCPAGYYRSSALLFGCTSSFGVASFHIPPGGLERVTDIPAGVKNLRLLMAAEGRVGLYLWDASAQTYVLQWKRETGKYHQHTGEYSGITVSCSTAEERDFPEQVICMLTGVLQSPLGLRLFNYDTWSVSTEVHYAYAGRSPCTATPVGCKAYDRLRAEQAAMSWSKDLRQRYKSAADAWAAVAGKKAHWGLAWHDWTASSQHEEWKMAFSFLDIDKDSLISSEEFQRAYLLPDTSAEEAGPGGLAAAGGKEGTWATATCPVDHFREAALLFHCEGGSGTAEMDVLGRVVTEIQPLPEGLEDLTIRLSTNGDVALCLWDVASQRYALHRSEGIISMGNRAGNYRGLSISWPAEADMLYSFKGKVPSSLILRVQNFGVVKAKATLHYSYAKVEPCPGSPVGCSPFDVAGGQGAARTWSVSVHGSHPSAEQAWAAYSAGQAAGILWHHWGEMVGNAPNWKLVFRHVDANNDGHVQENEFTEGYNLASDEWASSTTAAVATASTSSAVLPASTSSSVTTRPPVPSLCPMGYYQSESTVWECTGGSDSLDLHVAPGEVVELIHAPQGVRDLHLTLTADVDVDLLVWDIVANHYIVNWENGSINERMKAGSYQGLYVTYGGDDRMPPISETCTLDGISAGPLSVKLHNHRQLSTIATLSYTYAGLSPCTAIPKGCSHYDAEAAKYAASTCFKHMYRASVEDAWAAVAGSVGDGFCISRHRWKAACKQVHSPQLAFRYLDEDRSACLSKAEFTKGFDLVGEKHHLEPAKTLTISFVLHGFLHKRLSKEETVKHSLVDAIRTGIAVTCNDVAITRESVYLTMGRGHEELEEAVEARITPPNNRTAESIKKYCCSSSWLNSNIPKQIARVEHVYRVLTHKLATFNASCEVQGAAPEQLRWQPLEWLGFGPFDLGVVGALFGAALLVLAFYCLVNSKSGNIRLHAWCLLSCALRIFSAASLLGAARELARETVVFAPPWVHACVAYGLFMCTFALMQLVITLLAAGFTLGGSPAVHLDEQVWAVGDVLRSDCGEMVHLHDVAAQGDVIKSVALVEGRSMFVRKLRHAREREVQRIRSNTSFISHVVGFAAVFAGCDLQRMAVSISCHGDSLRCRYWRPWLILVPLMLNQILLFVLFRVAQFFRPSTRLEPMRGSPLRDARRDALLGEEVRIAEADVAGLASSFLAVQALQFWLTGAVPSLDQVEDLARAHLNTLKPKVLILARLFLLLVAGIIFASTSAVLAHISFKNRLATWRRRVSRVYMNSFAMCSAWCFLWVVQWALHRVLIQTGLLVSGELIAQVLVASLISLLSFGATSAIGRMQDKGGPEKMAGAVHSGVVILGVLTGVSWWLAFGAAAATVSEEAPQPLITRALVAGTLALLTLPQSRLALRKVFLYRQAQAEVLEARGHMGLAQELCMGGQVGNEGRFAFERLPPSAIPSSSSDVWRFYRRQDGQDSAGAAGPKLQVTMLSARNLPNADWLPGTGKSDPFCTCEVPGKPGSKVTTYVVNNDLNPVWNHTADISEYEVGDPLVFTVFDKDMTKDDLLGSATLPGNRIYPDGFEGELDLTCARKDSRAAVAVRVRPMPGLQSAANRSQRQLGGLLQPGQPSGWYVSPNGRDIKPMD